MGLYYSLDCAMLSGNKGILDNHWREGIDAPFDRGRKI